MGFHRIAAFAAFVLTASGVSAGENCGLGLMASLDMTVLPEGRIAVPVTINGTPRSFMVDTAGIYSKLSDAVIDQLGLKRVATDHEFYSVSGKEKVFSADVDSLKLGGIEARHFHVMAGNVHPPQGTSFDGVLAGDLLTQFDVEFDFAGRKLNLFSQDHCPGKVVYWTQTGYAALPFHMSGDHINFMMTLDGHDVTTDLDTGSATTWLRHKAAAQVFGLDETSPGMERMKDSPDDFPVYRRQFGELHLGGVAVKNPMIDILPDRFEEAFRMQHSEKSRDDPIYGVHMNVEALTLGMTTLSKLHLYIAFKEHRIYATAVDAK